MMWQQLLFLIFNYIYCSAIQIRLYNVADMLGSQASALPITEKTVYTCMYPHVYVCMHVSLPIHPFIHIYTYTHTVSYMSAIINTYKIAWTHTWWLVDHQTWWCQFLCSLCLRALIQLLSLILEAHNHVDGWHWKENCIWTLSRSWGLSSFSGICDSMTSVMLNIDKCFLCQSIPDSSVLGMRLLLLCRDANMFDRLWWSPCITSSGGPGSYDPMQELHRGAVTIWKLPIWISWPAQWSCALRIMALVLVSPDLSKTSKSLFPAIWYPLLTAEISC